MNKDLVHLFNLYNDELGNPEIPVKLRKPEPKFSSKRNVRIAAALVIVAVLSTVALFVWKSRRFVTGPPVTPPIAGPPLREQKFTYWLTVQKMTNTANLEDSKPIGEPFESSGTEIFGTGWRFQFNLQPAQSGALYLLNEGPGPDGKIEYNTLFPKPSANAGVAGLVANQELTAGPYRFVDKTGVEKLWAIWTSESRSDLDGIFLEAVNHEGDQKGVITDAGQIATVQKYLKLYESDRPEIDSKKAAERTFVKGKGEVVVSLVELTHKAY